MNEQYLKKIPFLENLSDEKISLIKEKGEIKIFNTGEKIINQGDEGDGMYILLTGLVDVVKDGEKVAQLKEYDFFGELAMITSKKRNANVISAKDSTVTIFLSKDLFQALKRDRNGGIMMGLKRFISKKYGLDTHVNTGTLAKNR